MRWVSRMRWNFKLPDKTTSCAQGCALRSDPGLRIWMHVQTPVKAVVLVKTLEM